MEDPAELPRAEPTPCNQASTPGASLAGERAAAPSLPSAAVECSVASVLPADSAPQDADSGFCAPTVSEPTGVPVDAEADPPAPRGEPACRQMPDLSGKSVFVLDANSLIFQTFHAIPEMTSPTGQPVNALFGFTRDVLRLIEERKPDYLFCAFDLPGPTFRHEMFPEYKAHRAEIPDDLAPQFDMIREMLAGLSVPALACEAYEADDILATLARVCDQAGAECTLVTADKDCRQLLSDRVKILNLRTNQLLDAQGLQADWGVRPEQVVDFQALVGDAIDGIPGVPQIGPKTARELLERFGTLEGVYANLDQVSGQKKRENLRTHQQQALHSRELARLHNNVPLALDWERGRVERFDFSPAVELCDKFGFRSLAARLREHVAKGQGLTGRAAGEPGAAGPDAAEPGTREAAAAAAPGRWDASWNAHYRLVATPQELQELATLLASQPVISVDTETTHIWPSWADLVGISFAWAPGEACYLPVRAPQGEPRLDLAATLAALKPILESPHIQKVGQNLKYDMIVLRTQGVELAGPRFDTMIASYLLEAGERSHNLDELSRRHLGHETIKIEELIGSGKNQRQMDEVPLEKITAYAAEDADVALRLQPILAPRLAQWQLSELFESLEMPLVDVLVELERNGIRVDVAHLEQLSQRYTQRMAALEQEVFGLAGHEFNIASPKQLQQVLFVEQKLPVLKRTKSGPSTDADVLEELARQHALPAKIIEYRQYAKLKGTYVDALPQMVNPRTGRVHCSFNQSVAATGRLSASDPNLQNIPIRTEVGREIRSAFLPGFAGWKLLGADYSQIELRVLAHLSGDRALCAAFANDEDIHTRVASEVYGVPPERVDGSMRRSAKAVNFGIIYGQSPFGLAKQLGIELEEAEAFIEAYFQRYPQVDGFLAKTLEAARQNGYVTTIRGRRRAIQGIRAGAHRQKNLPERTAINTVIQGSAADLMKAAMLEVHRRLKAGRFASRMLLQIHDELIFEVPPHEITAVADLVRHEMSQVMVLSVPLKVDISTGDTWADLSM
jgi:DNA polymerase-1